MHSKVERYMIAIDFLKSSDEPPPKDPKAYITLFSEWIVS